MDCGSSYDYKRMSMRLRSISGFSNYNKTAHVTPVGAVYRKVKTKKTGASTSSASTDLISLSEEALRNTESLQTLDSSTESF